MKEKVVVEYRTQKNYCHCCGQKFTESKTSDIKEFEISKDNMLSWSDCWIEIAEFEEDLQAVVEDFVYDTISFFATSSYENILIEDSEINKVKQFIFEILKEEK